MSATFSFRHPYLDTSTSTFIMTLVNPTSIVLQNLWLTLPFWIVFVGLLCATGAWIGLLAAFIVASAASIAHRTLINRRVPAAAGSAVFISGCSSGIGRAAVERLLCSGWIVVASVRRAEDAIRVKCELRDHPMLHTVLADISDERQVEAAAAEVKEIMKQCSTRLSAVVCNAGYAEHSPIELLPLPRLRAQFDTNTFGTVSVIRHFTPLLRQSASSRLLIVSSITGQFAVPGLGAYSATKYALEAIADSLRCELKRWNIAVCLVQPGQTETSFNATVQHTGHHLTLNRNQPHTATQYIDPSVRSHYLRAYNKFFHLLLPADSVTSAVDAVEAALTDSHPLPRYRSGWTSLPTTPFLLLPTELTDVLMGWWYR